MNAEAVIADCFTVDATSKSPMQSNPFLGHECVLKKCCKKYKKGKRCKKCPDR
ncbi:hypothetical protein [Spirosoma profusum]|uniref:hypothetical protein n=1 Tax=Spirosoma profusum TaxID=2771354 RepID=UPI0016823F8F|nr:hypothetical protein [Spirosoma profusum]